MFVTSVTVVVSIRSLQWMIGTRASVGKRGYTDTYLQMPTDRCLLTNAYRLKDMD